MHILLIWDNFPRKDVIKSTQQQILIVPDDEWPLFRFIPQYIFQRIIYWIKYLVFNEKKNYETNFKNVKI